MYNGRREHFCQGQYCQCKTIWTSNLIWNEETKDFDDGWECNNCGREELKRVVKQDNSPDREPTPSQQRALNNLRRYIESGLNPKYDDTITQWELTAAGYDASWWLTIETELLGLSRGNLLRALDHDHWQIFIGPRGRINAHSYPKSYDQFKGRQAFGINFN